HFPKDCYSNTGPVHPRTACRTHCLLCQSARGQTIAMLKAAAEAAAAATGTSPNGQTQSNAPKSPMGSPLTPKPYKKRGPKPGSK
ncbi:hypothetical protein M9458_023408, partial [Cirrhinus mrigala]